MNGIRLEPGLQFMVTTLAAQINGCAFCVDIGRAVAIRQHLAMEKLNALSEYRSSPLFSDRERAALAYVEEATRNKRKFRRHFLRLYESTEKRKLSKSPG